MTSAEELKYDHRLVDLARMEDDSADACDATHRKPDSVDCPNRHHLAVLIEELDLGKPAKRAGRC
jgi:hypothetical protein